MVAKSIRWETMDKVERKAKGMAAVGGGVARCNCSYFFSLPPWPGPETKDDPTSNIQIRKLPRRSVHGPDYPLSAPPKHHRQTRCSCSSRRAALNLHILLSVKPHTIPAVATVPRAY